MQGQGQDNLRHQEDKEERHHVQSSLSVRQRGRETAVVIGYLTDEFFKRVGESKDGKKKAKVKLPKI